MKPSSRIHTQISCTPGEVICKSTLRQRQVRRIMQLAGYDLRLGKPGADDLIAAVGAGEIGPMLALIAQEVSS